MISFRVFVFFVLFASFSNALTLRDANFSGLPPFFASTLNVPAATYEWTEQWQMTDPFIYGKNYTVMLPPDFFGCTPLPPSFAGKISIAIFGGNAHCQYAQMSRAAFAGGAVAVIGVIPFPISFSMVHFSERPEWNYPAVVTWGNLNDQAPVAQQVPMSIVMLQALFNGPVVVTLDFPVQNPTYTAFYTIPTVYGWIYWFTITLGLIALTFTQCKLYLFIVRGKMRSIATITLFISWLGSAWLVFLNFEGFGMVVPASPADFHTVGFFELWPYAFAATALVLMGFYFTEISNITSTGRKGDILDKMFIPGVVAVCCIWIITLIASFMSVYYRTGDIADTAGEEKYGVAAVFGLLGLFVLGIVGFGSISLFRRVNETRRAFGEAKQFWTVVRFLGLSIFASLNFVWGIVLYICCRYFFVNTVLNNYNELQVQSLFKVGLSWAPSIIFITMCGIFRIRVEEEIEKSKAEVHVQGASTGTTHASSANMASSAASTSASSHVDSGVVEL